MTPTGIEWVEVSDHAMDDRVSEMPSVDEGYLIYHLKESAGRVYKDTERDGHHYRMQCDDEDVTIAFVMEYNRVHQNKTAIVKTVFPTDSGWMHSDRFEKWDR